MMLMPSVTEVPGYVLIQGVDRQVETHGLLISPMKPSLSDTLQGLGILFKCPMSVQVQLH
jgi:hypothetical protein